MNISPRLAMSRLRDHSVPFIKENARIISQFIFTLFFIGVGIWFVKHERGEIGNVKEMLSTTSADWIIVGVSFTVLYVILQSLMYIASFRAVGSKVSFTDALVLFLKRNFISVFLPAGGISSLAFFTGDIEGRGTSKSQIHFASTIYGFVGILSVVIIAFPAFCFALLSHTAGAAEWYALISVVILLSGLVLIYRSILRKGIVYRLLSRFLPGTLIFMDELSQNNINRKGFLLTIVYSVLIEFIGIAHLYIAMSAIGVVPSVFAATMAYIVSVIFLIVSPFLRGLGAIEVSMAFILVRFGYNDAQAIAMTLFYRFLEFWLPLFAGAVSFLIKVNKLLMRILPAFLLFALGVINIVSVLTPTIAVRVRFMKGILPQEAISISNYFVLAAGLFLLVTAAFMLKGLRTAWYISVVLCCVSIAGNLTKAFDYEEAILATLILIPLIASRKEYYIKANPHLRNTGLQTTILSIVAVLLYGTIGFYFLDKRHFNVEFGLQQSIEYTLSNYFLLGREDLIPYDAFARNFLLSINISGILSLSFLVYTLIRPYVKSDITDDKDMDRAKVLLNKYGRSAADYFKTYYDKLIFLSEDNESFVSYRVSGNFAVVLEDPVAPDDERLTLCVREFEKYCYDCGLKVLYYRVSDMTIDLYRSLGKKALFLGQEAVVDLTTFSLSGGVKKSMRNALKKVTDRGFKATVHAAPLKDGLLQKIKAVSDEWLTETGRNEIIFSQGMFLWDELKTHTVITVENEEEKVVAFLNIIPDYTDKEGTYDLIRKTSDAPNGVMDFLLIEMFNYLKSCEFTKVNLGFAPMAGIDEAKSFPEKSMKFAYEKIRTFSHYKGLREYKEKFEPTWSNKYLIYDHDYDLIHVPSVLGKVIKP